MSESEVTVTEASPEIVDSEPSETLYDWGTDEAAPESEEVLEESVEAPVAPRFKVKVDGEELEVDQDTLLRDYQLSKASHKKFQEAARVREEAEQALAQVREIAAQAKNDPSVLFKALGLDPKQFAESLLLRDLEESLLSPEEKELRELRSLKEKIQLEEKERIASQQREREAQLVQEAGAQIEDEIVSALQETGLKPTPRTVARVAEMLLASMDEQGSRMKATDALKRLRGEYRSDVVELLESQDPEVIEKEYPSLYKKILAHAQQKVRSPMPAIQRGVGEKKQVQKQRPRTLEEILGD